MILTRNQRGPRTSCGSKADGTCRGATAALTLPSAHAFLFFYENTSDGPAT